MMRAVFSGKKNSGAGSVPAMKLANPCWEAPAENRLGTLIGNFVPMLGGSVSAVSGRGVSQRP
jgi:hypothetical protein